MKKKQSKMKVIRNCRSKKCGSLLISWETMIGKTFEKQAA